MFILNCLLLGLVSGFSSGLLGIGGGIIIVPGIAVILKHNGVDPAFIMQIAAGSSLLSIVFISIRNFFCHYHYEVNFYNVFFNVLPGLLLGIVVGSYGSHMLHTHVLRVCFSVFSFLVAIKFFFKADSVKMNSVTRRFSLLLSLSGVFAGALSSLLGIGSGTILIPLFITLGYSISLVMVVAIASNFIVAILGTISYIFWGWHVFGHHHTLLGYVDWRISLLVAVSALISLPFGAKLSTRISQNVYQRYFAILLVIIGIHMMFF